IGVGVWLRQVPATLLLEALDDEIVGLSRGDQPTLDLRPAGAHESSVRCYWAHQRQTVLDTGLEIIGAEGRREVHQAGAVIRSDEVSTDDHPGGTILRKRNHLEWTTIPLPDELTPRKGAQRAQLSEAGGAPLGAAREIRPGGREDYPTVPNSVLSVLQIGTDSDRHVGQQGPRRGGPNQELPPRFVLEGKRDIHRVGGDRLIAEGQLVTGENGATTGTVRQDPVAAG